jgi:branched-chain amino acid transport system permease protein
VVAGIILGLVDGLSKGYGLPEWTDAYSFGLMILILLIRPKACSAGPPVPAQSRSIRAHGARFRALLR